MGGTGGRGGTETAARHCSLTDRVRHRGVPLKQRSSIVVCLVHLRHSKYTRSASADDDINWYSRKYVESNSTKYVDVFVPTGTYYLRLCALLRCDCVRRRQDQHRPGLLLLAHSSLFCFLVTYANKVVELYAHLDGIDNKAATRT